MTDAPTPAEYYLAVSHAELRDIFQAGLRHFPPRGPGNPIFWPALTARDAAYMALFSEQHRPPYYAGYVLAFSFDSQAASDLEFYTHRTPGRRTIVEIPARQFDVYNRQILAPIRVIGAVFGLGYQGEIPAQGELAGRGAVEQLAALAHLLEKSPEAVGAVLRQNAAAVFLNYSAWLRRAGPEREAVLPAVEETWRRERPEIPLPIFRREIFSLEETARALVNEARAALEKAGAGIIDAESVEIYKLLNHAGDLLRAGGQPARACVYWHRVTRGRYLDGIPALEELRSTAWLLGKERNDFRTPYSPLDLLRQFVEEDGPCLY